MVATLLCRQLARSAPRANIIASSSRRTLTASALRRQAEPTQEFEKKSLLDVHTVEDLQKMTAADLLAESGSSRGQMRHFTGEFYRLCYSSFKKLN